ncbi:hypothetical protein [Alloalcanivorax mobilis]|uniref:hypothetical protein n=1 Tax=Alloalcanivorax mobilis TaxID=2019569 RepID=UPI0012FFF1D7|nr:hypothetical protein [Alloalcanivorax mobilis]
MSKSGGFVYNEEFHEGVNIIRGDNGTGKSTVMDLLNYSLGAVVNEWTDEQRVCDWVLSEVEINGEPYCLKRDISESGQEKMLIREGRFSGVLGETDGWYSYPYKRSKDKVSFSERIFELLGLPRHKTDEEKNLTMHQILRLMYVDQLSSITKLLKEDNTYDNPIYRRAIGEYLLGIDDLEAHNVRQDLIQANREFDKVNAELSAIYRFFGNEASSINMQALDGKIGEISKEVDEILEKIRDIRTGKDADLAPELAGHLEKLVSIIDKLSEEKQGIDESLHSLRTELVDTELFLRSLKDRKRALSSSKTTYFLMGGVQFQYCPVCLQPLAEHAEEEVCHLCKQEHDSENRDFGYISMLNEIDFQIKESFSLIERFKSEIERLSAAVPLINRKLEEAKVEYNSMLSSVNDREALISELSSKVGFCRSQMVALEDRKADVIKVENLRNRKIEANSEISRIQDLLDQLVNKQKQRFMDVNSRIEERAKKLLSEDDGYEQDFDSADEVAFDFAKDKMFVNNKGKFSASSMVILKNCVRLAIFLETVDDKEARLPSLLLMDNIEDKGMREERSQNFQHLIMRECQSIRAAYQLIFTTSMIAPDLDGTSYCVGPYYKKGMHTLNFNNS